MAARNPCAKLRRSPEGFEYTQVEGRDVAIQYGVHDAGEWKRHAHDGYQILLLPEAGSEAVLYWWPAKGGRRCRRMTGPHICTIEKHVSHALHWMRKAALVSLLVSENFVSRNAERGAMCGVTVVPEWEYAYKDIEIHNLGAQFARLCGSAVAGSPDCVYGMGFAQAARIIQARGHPSEEKRPPGLSPGQMEKVNRHIEKNLQERISVKTLARVAGVGKDQFSRVFRQATGTTPHQYVMESKMQHARRLMAEGKLRMCDIALEAGFYDQSHLRLYIRRLCRKPARTLVLS